MAGIKRRAFVYKRAVGLDKKANLQDGLVAAHNVLNEISHREFPYQDGWIRGAEPSEFDGGFYVRVTVVSGENVAAVAPERGKVVGEKVVGEILGHPAPEDNVYVKGEAYFFVVKNHVLISCSNVKDNVVSSYIYDVLSRSGNQKMADDLTLECVGNQERMNDIQKHGISEISFGVALYDASLKRMTKKDSFGRGFFSGFKDEKKLKKDVDNYNLMARMSFSFDRRTWKKDADKDVGALGQKKLQELAKEVISEEDYKNYVITLGNGMKINADQMKISKEYSVNTFGNCVTSDSAKKRMRDFYIYLSDNGVLAQ